MILVSMSSRPGDPVLDDTTLRERAGDWDCSVEAIESWR
jgi:hypothetical protein